MIASSPKRSILEYIDHQVALKAETVQRPLMRYFGGKWVLAKWVLSHFPAHRIYVEPYGGAASVLMQKDRSASEVYNDIDSDVVNLFRVLRDRNQAPELRRLLRLTPFSRDELELAYEQTTDQIEQARRLMIRSWMGFGTNGTLRHTGFRSNVRAEMRSTPARDWSNVLDHIDHYINRLTGVCIEHRSAIDVILGHDTEATLFYVDPPYPHSTRRAGRYRYEMSDQDHRDLARVLREVKGMVAISGYPCDLYDSELYDDWHRVEREHYADGHGPRTEILWLSPRTWEALQADRTPVAGPVQMSLAI